jgi:hypothetical protein
MLTGTKYAFRWPTDSAASTIMPSSPNFGGKSLPVRLRPPSMNNSIGKPSRMSRRT